MTPTTGTIGHLLFRVVTLGHFLWQVLLLSLGFLLLLFLMLQLSRKTLIFRSIDPFYWRQKGGEIFWWSYFVGVSFYVWQYLDYLFSVFGYVVCFMDIYFVCLCIWFLSLAWISKHVWTYLFLIWQLSLFLRLAWTSKHVWTYLFLIWKLSLLSLCGWSNHLPLILEAGGIFGWMEVGVAIGSGQVDPTRLLLDPYNNQVGSTQPDYYTGQKFRPRLDLFLVASTRPDPFDPIIKF